MLGSFVSIFRQSIRYRSRPLASEVLRLYLQKRRLPSWTSFFIRYSEIQDDHFARSHFNFDVDGQNYHVLRTGCYPYIKYHCTRRHRQDLSAEDTLFRLLKAVNLGIPCLCYGVAAIFLIRHSEELRIASRTVTIHFLIKEEHQ